MKPLSFIVASLLAAPLAVQADVMSALCSKGGAMVMPKDKLKLTLMHVKFDRNSMFDGSDEVTNNEKLDATAHITKVALSYGLFDETTLHMMIPYKNMSASASLGPNDVAIDNKGLGDIVVAARHVLLPMSLYGYQLSLDLGLKLPTGAVNGDFELAPAIANGADAPMPTQMGTGEFEYKIGLGYSYMAGEDWEIDAHTMYTYRPKAHNDYDFGDELSFDLSSVTALTKQLNVGIEYNFKYNTSTDMGDDTNAALRAMLPFKAFSGSAGYVTPQVEFLPFGKPKIHFGAGVSFLTNYDVKEYQPLEKKRLIFRVGYIF